MYEYTACRPDIFTDEGQRRFLKMRDHIQALLRKSGAVRMQEALGSGSGDSWGTMSLVDRMVELGELTEITDSSVSGQARVFISRREL